MSYHYRAMVPDDGGAMYAVQGWFDDGRETVYVDTWEEVLQIISLLEEDMYSAFMVTNMETGQQVA